MEVVRIGFHLTAKGSKVQRLTLFLAGVLGSAAVLLAAFAAHGLDEYVAQGPLGPQEARSFFETGLRNLMYHALCLGILGAAWPKLQRWLAGLALLGLLAGVVLFSGGLMWRALGGPEQIVPLVPVGGISYAVGWLLLALAAAWGNCCQPAGSEKSGAAPPAQ